MKSLAKNLIILTFLSLGTFSCFSQDIQPSEEIYKMIAQIKNSNFSANNLINNSSAVNIQQIGNNNSAIARSYASGIEMNLLQDGDNNYMESIVRVEDYKLNAIQNGNDNYFSNIPIFSEPGTELEVIQQGNNQHVENNEDTHKRRR